MTFYHNRPTLKPLRKKLRRDQTPAESILWQHLRNKQFRGLKFYRQYSFGSYILDFYCPAQKIAVELDGGHHAETKQEQQDIQRTIFLEEHGLKVVRFWNNEVFENLEGVLDTLWVITD